MSEEKVNVLEKSLAAILDKSLSGVEKGVDFLSAELPEIIEQLLMWHGVKSFILFFIGVAILTTSISVFCIKIKKIIEADKKLSDMMRGFYISAFLLGSFITFVTGLTMFFKNWEWLQIMIAPKLYLIEYTAELLK